jgi:RNA polymerase-binding protein DksA
MSRKVSLVKGSTRKTIARGVAVAAKTARASAKAVLLTNRRLPPPVEIEPRSVDSMPVRMLLAERERLCEELARQEVVEQERPTSGNHMADDATEVSEQAKSLALRRHIEGMLKEIDRAIARAERGMYGICERCGVPISQERLKVMPSATLCINCAKQQIRCTKAAA